MTKGGGGDVASFSRLDRPEKGHSGKGLSRYVEVNAKVLLDSADALQEVIDFLREARNVLGGVFMRVEPKADVSVLDLNVREPFAHLNA